MRTTKKKIAEVTRAAVLVFITIMALETMEAAFGTLAATAIALLAILVLATAV